jgi:hypothetical protein
MSEEDRRIFPQIDEAMKIVEEIARKADEKAKADARKAADAAKAAEQPKKGGKKK